MALELVISRQATNDINEIVLYMAEHSPAGVVSFVQRLDRVLMLMTTRPFMGRASPAVSLPDLRRMAMSPYVIFYRVLQTQLQIVRVLHTSRNIDVDSI